MELKQALRKIDEATGGELYYSYLGRWMVNATETTETLDDFEAAAKSYAACNHIHRGKLAGFDFIDLGPVQVAKGQPRFAFSVIDLGEVRFSLNENLSDFAD
jgi:hypothetical protein